MRTYAKKLSRVAAGLVIVVTSLIGTAVVADAVLATDDTMVTGSYEVDGPGTLVVYGDTRATFLPDTCSTNPLYSRICAPTNSPDGGLIVTGPEEDGSASYSDGSVFDPETREFYTPGVHNV